MLRIVAMRSSKGRGAVPRPAAFIPLFKRALHDQSQEVDHDMGLRPFFRSMKNGPDGQIALADTERELDLCQPDVGGPTCIRHSKHLSGIHLHQYLVPIWLLQQKNRHLI